MLYEGKVKKTTKWQADNLIHEESKMSMTIYSPKLYKATRVNVIANVR